MLERQGRRAVYSDGSGVPERRDPPHGDRLSRRQLNRLNRVLTVGDPTGEIGAAPAHANVTTSAYRN